MDFLLALSFGTSMVVPLAPFVEDDRLILGPSLKS